MSVHHQQQSPLLKFLQSPHRKRVAGWPCRDDGMFVYAAKTMSGMCGCEWATYPDKVSKLYRKITATHVRDIYYFDSGSSTWIYWRSATVTAERVYDSVVTGLVLSETYTGSDSGVLYSSVWNESSCTYDTYLRSIDDYVTNTDPNGDTVACDNFPTYSSVQLAWTNFKVTHVSDGEVTSYAEADPLVDGNAGKITSTVVMSLLLDLDQAKQEVKDMLLSVKLQIANQLSADGSGYFGLVSTQKTPYLGNLISLAYNETCGTARYRQIAQSISEISSSDDDCIAGEAREQTFHPAAFTASLPDSGSGNPTGVLYAVNDANWLPYGYWTIGSSYGYPDVVYYDAHAKKSLLTRMVANPDDWILYQEYDIDTETYGAAHCIESDQSNCLRYYFPTGTDLATGPNCYEFSGLGLMYREIPVQPLNVNPCPTGSIAFANPCP